MTTHPNQTLPSCAMLERKKGIFSALMRKKKVVNGALNAVF
ncbi:hypothetical protein [Holospora curviuscula]|nr:hypothetical protein [Holospora curviuscula]